MRSRRFWPDSSSGTEWGYCFDLGPKAHLAMSRLASLWALREDREAVRSCYASLPETAPEDYRKLAALLVAGDLFPARKEEEGAGQGRRAQVLGIGGGQGAGKSTLSALIAQALESAGARVCLLSLDDFYLTRAERVALSVEVHPLFLTRGPPGTHDISRLVALIDALRSTPATASSMMPAPAQSFRIPVFDKAEDDRVGERVFEGPADWVLLEGWCVGAKPLDQSSLLEPVNTLEAEDDSEGVWRTHFADCLAEEYAPLWEGMDASLFLHVPSLDAVRRWRLAQERAHPAARRLDAVEVARFVQHFERVTRSMWAQAPRPGQVTAKLGEAHEVLDLDFDGERDID